MAPSKIPFLPLEIITEILLRVPPKPLLKFKCVSKSWLQLISSPIFVKTHMKYRHHRVLYSDSESESIFKACSLPSLFCQEPSNDVLDMGGDSPMHLLTVGSANGLIYLFNTNEEAFLWNPAIRKSKKLSKFGFNLTQDNPRSCGFGYDELHDDYKVVFAEYVWDDATRSCDIVVNVHRLATDSWRTVNDEFQGGFLLNVSGEFVNGKLYWASSTNFGDLNLSNIISFDLSEETWGKLELPCCVKCSPHSMLGVVGTDLSVLSAYCLGTSSDVWVMKDNGVNSVSWTKVFTFKYPPDVLKHILFDLLLSFSMHFCESNDGEILFLLPGIIMIYNPRDGSTSQQEVIGFEKCCTAQVYLESLVDPLLIAAPGTSQP